MSKRVRFTLWGIVFTLGAFGIVPWAHALDGAALYGQYCAGCHGPLATSSKLGRTANQIQNAINNNMGGMGSLSSLTSAQIQAIGAALAPAPPAGDTTPPTISAFSIPTTSSSLTVPIQALAATDNVGVTGYLINESPTPPGATASGWSSSAPSSYTFTSGGTKTLYAWAKDAAGNVSASAIAQVTVTLSPASDNTPPVITGFTMPGTADSLTVSITQFTATDNVGITGYKLTESATPPSATASGWSSSAPSSYTFASGGTKTLYGWAKDAAGNVSASATAQVTITLLNPPPSSTVDLTNWVGRWLKMTIKYVGYAFGSSNGSGNDQPSDRSKDELPQMAKDHQEIAVYLKITEWNAQQSVLQTELYQYDEKNNQWSSDPLALHFAGGTPTNFLCWSQEEGNFTFGFAARVQGREKQGTLQSGSLKTLGGYYFEINGGNTPDLSGMPDSSGQMAGGLSMSGSLVPESKVPVPK